MKKHGNILKRFFVPALVIALCFTMPAMADWASAESADFSLNTTIPEPCTSLLAFVFTSILVAMRRHKDAINTQ